MARTVSFDESPAIVEHPSTISNIDYEQQEEESSSQSLSEQFQLNQEFISNISDYFEILDNDDYVVCVNTVLRERQHLMLENKVFEDFLLANEPQLISGLAQAKKTIRELEDISPMMPPILELPEEPYDAVSIIFSELGPRLNVTSKNDLVLRCIEEMDESLKIFLNKAKKQKFVLNAQVEESSVQIEDVIRARNMFEESMAAAIDPITQRIPAEKFVWFMDEWLKMARQTTEKLRLRNSSLKTTYNKVKAVLDQKIELGLTLHEVDFDQYRIENKHLREKIETANGHLLELKHFNGQANLDLATTKRNLQRINSAARYIKTIISKNESSIKEFKQSSEEAAKSLEDTKANYDKVKELISNCHAPDILEYLQVKAKLNDLLKTKKILERKENLQRIVMNTTKRGMLQLTGAKTFRKEWLEDKNDEPDDIDFDVDSEQTDTHIALSDSNSKLNPREFDIFTVIKCGHPNPLVEIESVSTVQQSKQSKQKFRRTTKRKAMPSKSKITM